MNTTRSPAWLPLWPLPALIALLAIAAVHAALWLSLRDGLVPACIPYWDGCTSISRAARHGIANQVFRNAMLICALLQLLHWWAARVWLRRHHPASAAGRSLLLLGAAATIALAVYALFLGTEGPTYRWLRRYGVVLHFACTYLAQLVVTQRLGQLAPAFRGACRMMLVLCIVLLALGLTNVATRWLVDDDTLKDRIENVLEWNVALLAYAWFAVQARLWQQSGFGMPRRDRA